MPSSSHPNGYGSSSSSRQPEHGSSHSRSHRPDRSPDDKYRRQHSPDSRHSSSRRGYDGRGDDHWSSSRSTHGSRYDDGYNYSRRDSRDQYERSYRSKDADHRDRYKSRAPRSPEPSRYDHRRRPPSPPHSWEYEPTDGWNTEPYRVTHWEDHDVELERRRSRNSGYTRSHDDRRSDRSPPRPARSHDHHRSENYGGDDAERNRYRREEDDRHSRRAARNRSRSRSRSRGRRSEPSRERPRVSDSKQDHRPSSSKPDAQSRRGDDRGYHSAQVDGDSDQSKLLKRKPETDAPTSKQSLQDRRDNAFADPARAREADRRQDEHRRSDTRSSYDIDSPRPARPHGDDTAARTSSASNGSTVPSSHSKTLFSNSANGSERHGWKSISAKDTAHENRTTTDQPQANSGDQPVSGTSKTETPKSNGSDTSQPHIPTADAGKRSFGHVLLPHELPKELRGKNYMATASYKEGVHTSYKTAAEKQVVESVTNDPRRDKKRLQPRNALIPCRFRWDADSVGTKPPPPPRTIVLTGLLPRTQPHEILTQIHRFGRIESSKLETHPFIGQSMGIFSVTFAHDLDEDDKPLASEASGQKSQNGYLCAREARLQLQGRIIGATPVRVFLDRDGKVAAEKVKEQLAEERAKKQVEEEKQRRSAAPGPAPTPAAAAQVSSSPATPTGPKASMPPPNVPRGPRASMGAAAASPPVGPAAFVRASAQGYKNQSPVHPQQRSNHDDVRKSGHGDAYNRRRVVDEYDSPRSTHYDDRVRSNRLPVPMRSEPRKQSSEEILKELRVMRRAYVFIPKPKNCDVDLDSVKDELDRTDPLWVREGDTGFFVAFKNSLDANKCKLVNETLSIGSYTLQVQVKPAPPLDPQPKQEALAGRTPGKAPFSAVSTAVQPKKTIDTGLRPLTTEEKNKADWTAAELQEAVFRMLQKELADAFIRDVKSRVVGPHLTSYLRGDGEGKQTLSKPLIKKPVLPRASDSAKTMSEANNEPRLPSFRKLASAKPKQVSEADASATKNKKDTTGAQREHQTKHKSRSQRVKDVVFSSDDESDASRHVSKVSARRDSGVRSQSSTKKRGAAAWLLDSEDEGADSDDEVATEQGATSRSVSASVEPLAAEQVDEVHAWKVRKGSKAKPTSAAKKKGAVSALKGIKVEDTPSEAVIDAEQRSETATPDTDVTVKAGKPKSKPPKASAKAKPIPADPFEAGLVEDGEDCHYLRLALEQLSQTGEFASEETLADEVELEAEAEEQAIAEGAIPKHSTGSARTEGYYRIPPAQKAMHLPDRNKATEDVDTSNNAQVLQSARNNRADSRRLVLGIEQHKRETATDTDMFKFNQLRTRKKQLKFAKSPIHDWGLYAMEFIPAGDMVIEYVGEVVRQQVADEREKQYERQGNFSTYLFRVDDDLVVDATHKGNIARLMNHCCTPNCNAKILTLNGEKRIVLFAKSPIRAGEELTYDYKFQSSADDEDAIPCLCGSPGCRRFL